ncbi:MAG: hypothetical protein WC471_02160 [Candidatus Woesearchaeota archaeon]
MVNSKCDDYANNLFNKINKSKYSFKCGAERIKIIRKNGNYDTDIDYYIYNEHDFRRSNCKSNLKQVRAGKCRALTNPCNVIFGYNFEFTRLHPSYMQQTPSGYKPKTLFGVLCYKKGSSYIITGKEYDIGTPHATNAIELKLNEGIKEKIPEDIIKPIIGAIVLAIEKAKSNPSKVFRVMFLPIMISEQYAEFELVPYLVKLGDIITRVKNLDIVSDDIKFDLDSQISVVALNSNKVEKFMTYFCKNSEKRISRKLNLFEENACLE